MPATKRPHVPLEQRREELVETAVRVMARDGAWALTTRAVAAEAGVPHGTVHYAFSSKDELLRAVLRRDLNGFAALIETARADAGDGTPSGGSDSGATDADNVGLGHDALGDVDAGSEAAGSASGHARSALTALFMAYADHVIASADTETAYFELSLMASRDAELRALVQETEAEYAGLFTRYLSDLALRADGAWETDLRVLAALMQSTVFGAAMSWLEHRDDALFRAVLAEAAARFSRGLLMR